MDAYVAASRQQLYFRRYVLDKLTVNENFVRIIVSLRISDELFLKSVAT